MILPRFHDSNLIRVHWHADQLTLDLDTSNGEKARLELTGVQSLRIDGLKEGNIVSKVYYYERSNFSTNEQEVQQWLKYLVAGDSSATS